MGDEVFGGFDESRRAFLKKALGLAFVAPAVVSFTMDALFEPAQAVPNMTCPNQTFPNQTCTNTITGNYNGPISVTSGTMCIKNATINGSVTVSNGASLSVENSTIKGSLNSNHGDTLWVTGSTITGPVTVNGNTGFVLIGGNGVNGAAGNTLGGGLTVFGNENGVRIDGNQIKGTVTVSNNSGGCGFDPVTGAPGAIIVDHNTIGGSLSGTGNNPPPQGTNSVAGSTGGQFRVT